MDVLILCVLILLMVDRFNQHDYTPNGKYNRASSTAVNVEELKRRLDKERKKDKTKKLCC